MIKYAFIATTLQVKAQQIRGEELDMEVSKYRKAPCESDADCGLSQFMVCQQEFKICVHKSIFPMVPLEIEGSVVLMILMTLAVISGIGGGGIVVPLLMTYYELEMKQAIAVSGFTILTGSIARYFSTINNRHPEKDTTTIEYGLSNVMLPAVLIGSNLGVFFNMIMPSIVLQILLTVLLLFLTTQGAFKAKEIWDKET